jgi:hypothetical protein
VLFSYPPVGYEDNWLHDVLIEMLVVDMAKIDNGQPRLRWPACIPQAHREALRKKSGLRDRRGVFLDRYEALSAEDRTRVQDAMSRHNAFPAIFDDGEPCISISDLPREMQDAIKSLFEFSFGLLTDLGLRDRNYRRLYNQLDSKVCAFCGVESLDAPGQRREALDHYLPIATYPFAGVNFRNLSPMGTKCNSRYKLGQNILVDPNTGNRRACCDPYHSAEISLSLKASRPFEGLRVGLVTCPDWVIQWDGGDPEKLQTWESVFAISERYRESSLNPNFRDWIDHFCQWAALTRHDISNPEALRKVLHEFSRTVVPGRVAEAAFLKRATFQMLEEHCNDTEEGRRVFDWLREQILERRALNASFK